MSSMRRYLSALLALAMLLSLFTGALGEAEVAAVETEVGTEVPATEDIAGDDADGEEIVAGDGEIIADDGEIVVDDGEALSADPVDEVIEEQALELDDVEIDGDAGEEPVDADDIAGLLASGEVEPEALFEPAEGVAIDEANFPDDNFRDFIAQQFDMDSNKVLSDEEIDGIHNLYLMKFDEETEEDVPLAITSLEGIGFFYNLEDLNCAGCGLTSLDVSQNPALCRLRADGNAFNALNVSACPNLVEVLKLHDPNDQEGDFENLVIYGAFGDEYMLVVDDDVALTPEPPVDEVVVALDGEHFPDDNFRAFISDRYDRDGNAALSVSEINRIRSISLYNYDEATERDVPISVTSLKGIEYFTGLTFLECYESGLTGLDISRNTRLETLNLRDNQLTALDLSANAELYWLNVSGNPIGRLDISACPQLVEAVRTGDRTEEDGVVSYENEEGALVCVGADTVLITEAGEPAEGLAIDGTNFPDANFRDYIADRLDLDGNGVLSDEEIEEVHDLYLKGYDVETDEDIPLAIATLEGIGFFYNLEDLDCAGCGLTSLDVSQNPALRRLRADHNAFAALDISTCPRLVEVLQHRNFEFEDDEDGEYAHVAMFGGPGEDLYLQVDETVALTPEPPKDEVVVAIDAAHFPDDNFRAMIAENYDRNGDGALSAFEIMRVREMSFDDEIWDDEGVELLEEVHVSVTTLKGIEYFTSLGNLSCPNNGLTSLDVSALPDLYRIDVHGNPLTTLKLGSHPNLYTLACYGAALTSLDISGCTDLLGFVNEECYHEYGDVANYSEWYNEEGETVADRFDSGVTFDKGTRIVTDGSGEPDEPAEGLPIDAAHFPDAGFRSVILEKLDRDDDEFLSEEELAQGELLALSLFDEAADDEVPVRIASLEGLSLLTGLRDLDCHGCGLTALDVSGNPGLVSLRADGNAFEALDVSACPALVEALERRNHDYDGDFEGAVVYGEFASDGLLVVDERVSLTPEPPAEEDPEDDGPEILPGPVVIDEAHFPDENLRAFVKKYDKDKNGTLSSKELAAVTTMDVDDKGIASMEGIQYFTALKNLSCSYNPLDSLDLRGMTTLTSLGANMCSLQSLDVTGCTALKTLDLQDSQVQALDISTCKAIRQVNCIRVPIRTLNARGCAALVDLNCYEGGWLESVDLSGCTGLKEMDLSYNNLSTLDVSGCTGLTTLACGGNRLKSIDVSNNRNLNVLGVSNNGLTSIDVSALSRLEELMVDRNQLTSLELSHNPKLFHLAAQHNQLASLDLSHNPLMGILDIFDNRLTSLNLRGCTNLTNFDSSDNQLTSLEFDAMKGMLNVDVHNNRLTFLNVSGVKPLWGLNCANNRLASLDLSLNSEINSLDCSGNQLTKLDLSRNKSMYALNCVNNQISAIALPAKSAMSGMHCEGNRLKLLDISSAGNLCKQVLKYAPTVEGGVRKHGSMRYNEYDEYVFDCVFSCDEDVDVRTTAPTLTLIAGALSMTAGDTADIVAADCGIVPGSCGFATSNAVVATVDDEGTLYALEEGTATITVTYGGQTKKLTVTVFDPRTPREVRLDPAGTANLYLRETLPLKVFLEPAETAESDVTWKSSDTNIATVEGDAAGAVVTPVKVGTVTITATAVRGKQSASVKVTIADPYLPAGVSIDAPERNPVYLNEPFTLTAPLAPSVEGYTPESPLTWTTSDKKVLAVDKATGEVTPKKVGKATITVTTRNKKTAKITLKVIDATLPSGVTIETPEYTTLYLRDETKGTLQLAANLVASVEDRDPVSGLTWTTSNKKVLAVDKATGLVTAKKAGTAKITVTTRNKKKATISLKVVDATLPSSVSIAVPEYTTLYLKDETKGTLPLEAILQPSVEDREPSPILTWTTSNKKVLAVDKATGLVTAKKAGTAKITVTTKNKRKATISLKVIDATVPAGVKIVEPESGIEHVGTSSVVYLVAGNNPSLGSELVAAVDDRDPVSDVTWSSSNAKVLAVDKATGKLTPKKVGTVTIKATTVRGKRVASLKLAVMDPTAPIGVTIDQGGAATIAMSQGKTLQLSATLQIAEGYALKDGMDVVTWSSSKTKIAKVNKSTGEVTAVKAGKATITATTKNGKKATITITITK